MHLTKPRLKQIIKEEIRATLINEGFFDFLKKFKRKKSKKTEENVDTEEAKHNVDKIDERWSVPGWEEYNQRPLVQKIVNNLPLLHDHKVIDMLGNPGAFGRAYLLDNDHVLKIFEGGVEGTERELENYKRLQDKQFAGTASVGDLAVYDYGEIPNTKYYFAEIGRLIPLPDWYKITDRYGTYEFWPLRSLSNFKNKLYSLTKHKYTEDDDPLDPEFQKDFEKLFKLFIPLFKADKMTDDEIEAYHKAVLNLIEDNGLGKRYDVHDSNVGVLTRQGDVDEFVIFDF